MMIQLFQGVENTESADCFASSNRLGSGKEAMMPPRLRQFDPEVKQVFLTQVCDTHQSSKA